MHRIFSAACALGNYGQQTSLPNETVGKPTGSSSTKKSVPKNVQTTAKYQLQKFLQIKYERFNQSINQSKLHFNGGTTIVKNNFVCSRKRKKELVNFSFA
eukprot:TRINITY_DN3274_c3_g2_i4.p4 TRINITY_DN3274_c3_g2~~TRINITY_DN3274_c3_g2_i4.p4  ORF type:complete len:100 (-),score=8.03 TRINITY_DN3274_c3_g2_i4:10-309(-)